MRQKKFVWLAWKGLQTDSRKLQLEVETTIESCEMRLVELRLLKDYLIIEIFQYKKIIGKK